MSRDKNTAAAAIGQLGGRANIAKLEALGPAEMRAALSAMGKKGGSATQRRLVEKLGEKGAHEARVALGRMAGAVGQRRKVFVEAIRQIVAAQERGTLNTLSAMERVRQALEELDRKENT